MSPEERIRRAEEIYYSRRQKLGGSNVRMSSSQVTENAEKRQYSLYKKMVLQILVCVFIYLVFSLIKDANYFFSEGLISKTKQMLSTDINFKVVSENVGKFFENNEQNFEFINSWLKNSKDEENDKNNEASNVEGNNTENISNENLNVEGNQNNVENKNETDNQSNTENKSETGNQNNSENKNEASNQNNSENNNDTSNNENTKDASVAMGIGGGSDDEETVQVANQNTNTATAKTQMEKDAEYIKANYKMKIPVSGKITSPYGKREPTEIVSENHKGIDIGVNVGTTVVAAMEGKVSLVSNEGSYGTHVKIEKDDITTIYAHCSKILVKEGQEVKLGQKIALSGNTGNTTGPHLHFEIRRSGRTINPELILKWG